MGGTKNSGQPSEQDREALPWRLVAGCWAMQTFNGAQYSIVFVLAVYLVRNLSDEETTEQQIGRLTGLLAGASSLACAISSYPWGLFSDLIGRKAVVVSSCITSAAALLAFGCADTFAVAIAARLATGLLNGSPVVTKAMLGEVLSPRQQARAFGYVSMGDSLGTIGGPVIAGLLAEHGFRSRPYLLPCLVVAIFGLATGAFCVVYMPETLPEAQVQRSSELLPKWLQPRSDYQALMSEEAESPLMGVKPRRPPRPSMELVSVVISQQPHVPEASIDMAAMAPPALATRATRATSLELGCLLRSPSSRKVQPRPASQAGKGPRLHLQKAFSLDTGLAVHPTGPHDLHPGGTGKAHPAAAAHAAGDGSDRSFSNSDGLIEEEEAADELLLPLSPPTPWFRDLNILLVLAVTAFYLAVFKLLDELAPLFVSAPRSNGGLQLPMSQLSWPMSVGGLCLTFFAIYVYPAVQRVLGPATSCNLALAAGVPIALILPFASLTSHRWLQQVLLYSGIILGFLFKACCFTSSMIICNMLGKGQLGQVNGARLTLAALGRAFGPIVAGLLWGWSAAAHSMVAGSSFLGFATAAVLLLISLLLHRRIQLSEQT